MIARRILLAGFIGALVSSFAKTASSVLRGRLKPGSALATEQGVIALTSDTSTQKVLNDERIAGMELELNGHFVKAGQFAIDPMETHSMLAIKDGKRVRVTYWCDVCAIRSFTPGLCVCCQQETRLDLVDPAQL
jgi:hypothetical protein